MPSHTDDRNWRQLVLLYRLVCAALLVWAVFVFAAPQMRTQPRQALTVAGYAVAAILESTGSGDAVRWDSRMADNLVVYVPRERYARIPVPDREALFKRAAWRWCKESFFLFESKVAFRDLHSDEKIDSYSCVWLKWANEPTLPGLGRP